MVKRAHESPEERQQREEQEAAAAAAAARAAELAALEGEFPPMQPSVLRCVLQVRSMHSVRSVAACCARWAGCMTLQGCLLAPLFFGAAAR